MLMGEDRVEHGALLGGIGVQFATHPFHAVEDVPGTAVFGALEDGVLHKVGQAMMAVTFVTAAGVHGKAAPGHLVGGNDVDHSQAVGECMIVSCHLF